MKRELTARQRMNRAEWKFVGYFFGIILVLGALWSVLRVFFD